jgi:hypothetical protein
VAAWLETHQLMTEEAVREAEARKAVYNALEFGCTVRAHPDIVRKINRVVDLFAIECLSEIEITPSRKVRRA